MSQDTCNTCALLKEGCMFVTQDDMFYTLASRLLCQIKDNTAGGGGGGGGAAVEITPEATYPKVVTVTSGGAGVTALAANSSRKPGSYIRNISDVEIQYFYGSAITGGAAGVLAPGELLSLGQANYIYTGQVMVYQASGTSKSLWVASFV